MAKNIMDYAKAYARKFHAVVPVGCWTFTGTDGEEVDLWKKPLLKNWTTEPLSQESQISNEWNKYGYYKHAPNIGIATGQICGGYLVIDLDDGHKDGVSGLEELEFWQNKTGLRLPETWTVISGGGGMHLWYRTNKAMRSYSNGVAGVDLRADGGLILVPPSIHKSGKRYFWDISPGDMAEAAEADEAVYRFIEEYRPQKSQYSSSTLRGQGGERKMQMPEEIPEGIRREKLVSLIGTLNRLGVCDEAIELAIRTENAEKCIPPMTEMELQKEIFPAIYRWDKGVSADQWMKRKDFLTMLNMDVKKRRKLLELEAE